MSQGALAKAVGLTSSEVSRMECGYRDIRPDEAAALAKALGLVVATSPAPVAVAATVVAPPSPLSPPALAPIQAIVAQVAPAPPVGNNLDDPANFTELPDLGILERGALPPTVHRERLFAGLSRANKVLHTSRVRAAVWREWRQFERKIHALLQAG